MEVILGIRFQNREVSSILKIRLDKVKVKVTPVQALRLCTGRSAHRGSRRIALPFHDHGTRRGEGSASRSGRSLPREKPGTHCTGGWVGPRAGLDSCRYLSPTGIRSPHRPARSQSLYGLGGPQGRSGQVRKSRPAGIRSPDRPARSQSLF
jgi:hypothetical protein